MSDRYSSAPPEKREQWQTQNVLERALRTSAWRWVGLGLVLLLVVYPGVHWFGSTFEMAPGDGRSADPGLSSFVKGVAACIGFFGLAFVVLGFWKRVRAERASIDTANEIRRYAEQNAAVSK